VLSVRGRAPLEAAPFPVPNELNAMLALASRVFDNLFLHCKLGLRWKTELIGF